MILKKPYAFFIRYFKFLHLIIFALSSLLLYRTSLIYDFMKEYNKTTPNLVGRDLTSHLFSPWLYILITIIIAVNIVIIIVMIKKDKPAVYYLTNILLYMIILLIYIVSHSIIRNMQTMLVEARTTLAIRDITNLARLFQTISVIFYLIRATGFDIKKFDFVRDLKYLDITAEDSEEIEVSLEFEGNEYIRTIRKLIRNGKYYYKENKFIINMISLVFLSLILTTIYFSTNKYNRSYKENDFFNASGINMGIKESYIIAKNYKYKKITDEETTLVALKISASSHTKQQLQLSRTVLVVNGNQYYHIKNEQGNLIDLGNTYNSQDITSEFKDYILVYKIPKKDINKKMTFRYVDKIKEKRNKKIVDSLDVNLNPIKIDEQEQKTKTYELGNQIELENIEYKITINNYEISDSFTNTYNSCISEKECNDYKEIIRPSVTTNTNKVLLKIDGNTEIKDMVKDIKNIPSLITEFGTIEYTINGKTYEETGDFNEVNATKTNQKNITYIEVNEEIKNAEKIKLQLRVRNNVYEYVLKGGI